MADNEKKESKLKKFGASIKKWFKDLKSEIKKVIWPGPKKVLKNTGVVLIVVVIVGALTWILDALLGAGLYALISAFS